MMLRAMRKMSAFLMDIVEVFVISMSIFIVVYLFLMQPHQVKGSSMFPTYHDGEYLMTDKVSYRTRTPKRGEVVVFKAPVNEDFDFIKRVIGIPGDTVMVKGGKVYVNGQMIDETYLPPEYETRSGRSIREGVPVTVGPEEYIVFGDNRGHSSDSREWGTVPIDNFIGRAFFLYWPPNRVGVIGQDGYAPFAKLEN